MYGTIWKYSIISINIKHKVLFLTYSSQLILSQKYEHTCQSHACDNQETYGTTIYSSSISDLAIHN